jgi:iron complex transport system substrate-binding protein
MPRWSGWPDNDPSFEAVVGKKPDLVTTQFQWQIGP